MSIYTYIYIAYILAYIYICKQAYFIYYSPCSTFLAGWVVCHS